MVRRNRITTVEALTVDTDNTTSPLRIGAPLILRIGERYINLWQMTRIVDTGTKITVVFVGQSTSAKFKDEEATALRSWLHKHATHIRTR